MSDILDDFESGPPSKKPRGVAVKEALPTVKDRSSKNDQAKPTPDEEKANKPAR